MMNGKEFAERLFSEIEDDNEIQEKLYSTGNDELDDLLERAFCEGYEYAQKEFAKKDEGKKKHTGAKVAAGVAGTAAAGTGVVLGANELGKHLQKKGEEKMNEVTVKTGKNGKKVYMDKTKGIGGGKFIKKETYEKTIQSGNKKAAVGRALQKPAEVATKVIKKVARKVVKK